MNEDETTQTLSDKVLDRANVLRFNAPPRGLVEAAGGGNNDKISYDQLPYSEWKKWIKSSFLDGQIVKKIDSWLENINVSLEKVGRPIGYRVQKAIMAYVRNYPGLGDERNYKIAFADQVELRILPKVRGIDMNSPQTGDVLDSIADVLDELGDEELRDAFSAAKVGSTDYGIFTWRGVSRR